MLYSLRPYFAPFKTDCEKKKTLFCKLLQIKCTYFCEDSNMEENRKILNRNEYKQQYKRERNRGPSPRRVE